MRADTGSARIFGHDVWEESGAVHARVAYVPGDVSLWPNISGGEAVDLLTRLRGAPLDAAYRRRRTDLVDAFQFDPSKRARSYSKGNRQKVALIAALGTPADLYVFDEPTSGLDPWMENVFTEQVNAKRAAGATVLLSSHILSEVQRLAQRVTIVRDGRTVESGSLDELRHLARTQITFAAAHVDRGELSALPGVGDPVIDERLVHLTADPGHLDALLPALGALHVQNLTIAPPSLEDVFLQLYDGRADERDGVAAR
jgi:ABC-2 type transport system ATP-binding protein